MTQRTRPETLLQAPHQDMPVLVRYWILRLIIDLKMEHSLIGRYGFRDEDLAAQIGLGEFMTEDHQASVDLLAVRKALRRMQQQVESLPREVPPVLAANVRRIAELVGLNLVECRLFEFAILMHAYPPLRELCGKSGNLRTRQLAEHMAALLELPRQEVYTALRPQSTLSRSGLLSLNRGQFHSSLEDRLELLSESLPDRLTESIVEPSEWLRDMVRPGAPGHLQWRDYTHLSKPLDVLRPYLRHALQVGRAGVNVLLYGPPGTGKTQLARLLAKDLGCELFEVTSEDEDNDPIGGRKRVKAHCAANSFFAKHRAIILFDEVEEVFADNSSTFGLLKLFNGESKQQQAHKGWLNRILETNELPTIWVANSLMGMDAAFARRFDIVMEMPVPPRSHRERILRETGAEWLDAQTLARLSDSEQLAPAVVAKAISVVGSVADQMQATPSAAVHLLINNTLQAQGHRPVRLNNPDALPEHYDPSFIHADCDLAEVARMLQSARTGRLCLYGPPGTGKTAYGRWLAQQLEVPLHVRRASDLLHMYVGESEKNIARAFAEAEADGGVLLIDEVDSFLQDRQGAQRSWEVSQVNEMLAQMEAFSGVFIASTNLMERLDPAVLRRFDLKVRFDPLRAEQAVELLRRHCAHQGLPEPEAEDLSRLQRLTLLTPGDYAAVQRQNRLRPLHSPADWVTALQAECALKPKARSTGMGFV